MRSVICALFMAVAVLAQGCAAPPQYKWYKAGSTQNEFNRDSYDCQTEAARTYPPAFVTTQLSPSYTGPATTNCYSRGSASGGPYGVSGNSNTTCTTSPGVTTQGLSETSDRNRGYRLQAAQACMQARGYQLRQVPSN